MLKEEPSNKQMTKKDHFQISSAIDYPSGPPHLGHTYEKIICDILARWKRLKGNKVHFSTGLDCHGSKIERYANEAGKSPSKFVKELEPLFLKLCKEYNISYDDFIKTTEKRHEKVVIDFIKDLHNKGEIYEGVYSGYYCSDCETYYSKEDLINGKDCPTHGRLAQWIEEKSYFFKMGKYQKKLLEHIKKNPEFIQPKEIRNEIINRLNEPLRDLSLTREKVKWGIPFPLDKNKIVAIWSEALLNYLTTIDYPNNKYKDFWPALHVIGRDLTWHHVVIWGSMLMSAGVELPKIFVHGFIRSSTGEKMSKSLGNIIDPLELIKYYSADTIRYYLLRGIPLGQDGDFSENLLVERINNELANELGNLVSRVLSLAEKKLKGKISKDIIDENFANKFDVDKIANLIDNFELHTAVNEIMRFVKECNRYINEEELWDVEGKELEYHLYSLLEAIRIISILFSPFIPETSEKINAQLGVKSGNFGDCDFGIVENYKVKRKDILFKKIEVPEPPEYKEKKDNELEFEDFDFRVGEIKGVKDHPNADKLYIEEIDLGKDTSDKIQVVSGIKDYYKKEELIGKKVIILRNLKPAMIRGIESQGMLLAAVKEKKLSLLTANKSRNGGRVFLDLREKAKKEVSINDFEKLILTTKNKRILYEDKVLRTEEEEIKLDKNIGDGARIE